MKLKIKYRVTDPKCKPYITKEGEWFDLSSSEQVVLKGPTLNRVKSVLFEHGKIKLGIAMQLPKHYEAILLPRSSTFDKKGILMKNNMGVIDSTYCGNDDIWSFAAIAFRDTTIDVNERICQFRIQPSQKAPFWVKLKWIFYSGVEFVQVSELKNINRGGFGTTNGYK